MIGSSVLASVLEGAINRYLRLDPEVMGRLAALSDKVIALELAGLGLTVFVWPNAEGVTVTDQFEGTADTRVRGTPFGLMGLARAGETGPLFGGDVEIIGDTETGQTFKAVLDSVEVDWEEQLSRLIGDVAAHQVGSWVRGAVGYARDTKTHLEHDLAAYITEEARYVAAREELAAFVAEVDELRSDADRLEARVERLRERADEGSKP